MSWPMVELGEVARAKSIWPTLPDNEAVLQLTLDHIEANSGRLLSRDMKPIFKAGTSTIGFNESHVLYSKLRPYLNKVFLPNEIGIATSEMVPVLPDEQNLDRSYLAHFLKTHAFVDWANQRSTGAKMPRTNMKLFWLHKIPLPPLAEQKRIAAILDKADAIRRKREKAIAFTDTLLKSVFLDMFGEPQSDWKEIPFGHIAVEEKNSFVNGPFGSNLLTSEFRDSGVPVYYIQDIRNGCFFRKSSRYVTESKAAELASCKVCSGDVLVAKVGDPPGAAAVYPNGEVDGIVTQDVVRIRPNLANCSAEYIADFLNSHIGERWMSPIVVEATRSRFGLGELKKKTFVCPPANLQNEYRTISLKIQNQRKGLVNAFDLSQSFLASLTQRAFRRELTSSDLATLNVAE